MKYINEKITHTDPILKEEEVNVTINVPNPSPYIVDETSGSYSGPIKVNDEGVLFDPA